jgi:hypothetical protein
MRFEFIGGSEMVSPLGSKAANAAFTEGYNKRRTAEHRTSFYVLEFPIATRPHRVIGLDFRSFGFGGH